MRYYLSIKFRVLLHVPQKPQKYIHYTHFFIIFNKMINDYVNGFALLLMFLNIYFTNSIRLNKVTKQRNLP